MFNEKGQYILDDVLSKRNIRLTCLQIMIDLASRGTTDAPIEKIKESAEELYEFVVAKDQK